MEKHVFFCTFGNEMISSAVRCMMMRDAAGERERNTFGVYLTFYLRKLYKQTLFIFQKYISGVQAYR